MYHSIRQHITQSLFLIFASTFGVVSANNDNVSTGLAEQSKELPYLSPEQAVENTPVSGVGFRTTVFGQEQTVPTWDRRSFRAWQLGIQFNFPGPQDRPTIPFGAIYWWENPEQEEKLFYGTSVLIYNDIFFAKPLVPSRGIEGVLTFNSNTIPFARTELLDGQEFLDGSLYYGYVRPGFGFGYRKNIGPYNDNMFAVDFIIEPGYLYFGRDSDTAPNFVTPKDTFEIRTRVELRWDKLTRNILNMADMGYAAGANLIYGHRTNWARWGINGQENDNGRNYVNFEAYWIGAVQLPFTKSRRHRLLGSTHTGIGHNLDRFSAERVGGGPNPKGDAYSEIWRPLLPGAQVFEYFPENYAILTGEYRWQATFFSYLSLGGGIGTLNPLRQTNQGIKRRQTVYPFLGAQMVTGFLGNTRLTLSYTHNWGVVRDGKFGGNEIMAWVAGTW